MALSLSEVEQVCRTQFPCEVKDKGSGIHAMGHHTFEIIVGMKKNPAHDKSDGALPGQKTAPPLIPDSRTLHIPGNWDADKLLDKIQGIKNSLPENRSLPNFDKKITGIAGNPEGMYDPELVKKAKQRERQMEQATAQNEQIVATLGTMANALTKLNERLDKLEAKKKPGRKPKDEKPSLNVAADEVAA